ncbi:hypothetical protein VTJ04DRAFT_9269 [Mycothermus thermophilus]|uniref:uncharacterized protein n=1 Tax=Humicola insolens TaxID=85995 RepID=UPI003742D099
MAALDWETIKSAVIFFGPILLPKLISWYREATSSPQRHGLKIIPLPLPLYRVIALLTIAAGTFLLLCLPIASPENIFTLTQSRLQIPADVLFTRLSSLRPNRALTDADLSLRARFANLDSRLLYLQFGPSVVATCPFCTSDEPRSYLYYALPSLLTPHLTNLVIIALVTSPLFTTSGTTGPAARPVTTRFRQPFTLASVVLAFADTYRVATYPTAVNARALRLNEIDFFFWSARRLRYLLLAALDLVLAYLIWMSATNRGFVTPPPAAERVESVARALAGTKGRVNAAGVVKNTVLRDDELRARSAAYWAHEVRLMREMMEEREVVEGVKDALENRIDIGGIERDAEAWARAMLDGLVKGGQEKVEVVG